MDPSTAAWLVLLAMVVAVGGFIWLYDRLRRRATPRQKFFFASTSLLLAALLLWWGFMVDQADRRQTLYETILPGTLSAVDAASSPDAGRRITEFDVVHPGEIHALDVVPQYPIGTLRDNRSRGFPIDLSIQLHDSQGNRLVNETQRLEKPSRRRLGWNSHSIPFVPRHAGKHQIRLELRTPNIPEVRVRVGDPLYAQGSRVKGW